MAKTRIPSKDDSAPEESNPDAPTSTSRPSDEPVDLSTLDSGVLHNPPQATQSGSGTTDEE
ncbi:hypothetical protein [Hymenobacter sp. HDW8]|uniref:hypothetical protein n=1 Tax=Hymenobacter sp. HDW8 TaxID=2714932 RepID=UPI00140723BD|nr:hypothetical protein [Hymenobacter sp. HDW8]QIL77672.1 hypothetical protein G7064_18880 [Hymenobacter sp. HDW8]